MAKKFLTILATCLLASVVCAQMGQTGGLKGVVYGPDGVGLPGVEVVITSPNMVLPQMTKITNETGIYRFFALSPGLYQASFQLEGFNTLVQKDIKVSAGVDVAVDVTMSLGKLTERIEVEGKAQTIDRQNIMRSSSLGTEFIKSIPTGRTVNAYFSLAPGVLDDGDGLSTAHGSPTIGNALTLDGVNLGDAATGTFGVSFGMDIMEEMVVSTGGFSAEHGNVQGGLINVVTKSGGNRLTGSLSFYLDHESLQDDNTEGTGLTASTGNKIQYEPVLTLGGPLIKDKLWFFFNLSALISETYEPGYPANAIGDPDLDDIAIKLKRYYPYVKLTFQPSQRDKIIMSYNFYDFQNNHRFADEYTLEEATSNQTNPSKVMNLHWTHTFGENFYTNFKIAMIDRTFKIDAKNDSPMLMNYAAPLYYGGYWRNHDDYQRDRYQANIDATTFIDDLAGSHEIKFGGEYSQFNSGWYVNGIPEAATGACYVAFFGVPYESDYYYGLQLIGEMDRKEQIRNLHFFIRDNWNISSNLTLNLGVRYEYNSMYYPAQGPGSPETYVEGGVTVDRSMYVGGPNEPGTAYGWKNFLPRLGFIYDLFADGTTLLKASYGRYLLPNQLGFVNLAHPNGWFGIIELYFSSDGSMAAWLPWSIPGASATIGHPNYDLNSAYTDELTISFERELWEDWSLGLRYIKKWDKDLICIVDEAQLDLAALMDNGTLDWSENWTQVAGTDTYDGSPVNFWSQTDTTLTEGYILNPPGAERNYDGFEVTLNKRYSNGWQMMASYVYAHSRGLITTVRGSESLGTSNFFANPNYHINRDGRLPLERRHQFKLQALVKGPWGINVSGYLRSMAGERYNRQIRSVDLAVTLNQGGETIMAEERGAQGYPWQTVLDVRLEKSFKLGNFTLSVFGDLFNAFNTNSAIEVYFISSNATNPFNTIEDILDPRVLRLGARLEWN